MSSSRLVPETAVGRKGAEDSPVAVIRRCGLRNLLRDALIRMRYGDGFSHARALALLLCMAVVPFLIALTGLADEIGMESGGRVVAFTTLALTPGRSDALVRRLLLGEERGDTGEVALTVGLVSGIVALAGAMAQIERGANRLYGIRRDRPPLHKYVRALILTVVAGIPAFCGFVFLVAGRALGDSLGRVYGWGAPAETTWTTLHLPTALLLTVAAVAGLFRWAPRRHQPSLSWLLPGVVLATVSWIAVTALLAVYVTSGLFFSEIYGPLAGVIALLLWANISGITLFFGMACCAQLEACRAGDDRPVERDAWDSHHPASR